jgi:hypothetical protein
MCARTHTQAHTHGKVRFLALVGFSRISRKSEGDDRASVTDSQQSTASVADSLYITRDKTKDFSVSSDV